MRSGGVECAPSTLELAKGRMVKGVVSKTLGICDSFQLLETAGRSFGLRDSNGAIERHNRRWAQA